MKSTNVWARLFVVVLVIGAALTMIGLGVWQLQRLQARRADNAEIGARLARPAVDLNTQQPGDLPEYQRVRVRGVYDFSQEIVLRNRAHLDSPGVHVLTPLRITGSEQAVLVDRGWIPYTEAEPELRAAYQGPEGEVVVEGIVRTSRQRPYAFLPADPTLSPEQPRLDAWYWVNLGQIQQQVPYPLLPYYVESGADEAPSELPIAGYEVDLSDGPHLSYAIQWFAFAAIVVSGSVGLWWQSRRKRMGSDSG